MYVEFSGTDGAPGNIQSGIAIANNTTAGATVTLELTNLNGSSAGLPPPTSLTVPASGHTAQFLGQFFPNLRGPFRGILRVSTTSAGVAVVGLRARYNERSDFLITTTPPANELTPASSAELYFPHLADGGGYTTQFIVFSALEGQTASGSLILVQQSGQPFMAIDSSTKFHSWSGTSKRSDGRSAQSYRVRRVHPPRVLASGSYVATI